MNESRVFFTFVQNSKNDRNAFKKIMMLKRNSFYIEKKDSFIEEITSGIAKLNEDYRQETILGATVFLNASGNADFFEKRKLIQKLFDEQFKNLPVSIISQSAGAGIAFEIWTHPTCKNLIHKKYGKLNYTVYTDFWGKSVWGWGLSTSEKDLTFKTQIAYSFELMQAILVSEGLTMDHLVRQWNYIPGILHVATANGHSYQNYQVFNEIRQHHYATYKKETTYPSATGIGMDYGAVTIDFWAMQKSESVKIAGLDNPNQIAAYNYGQDVLVGSSLKENETKKKPLFERAKYIGSSKEALVLISGTASIVGEKTIGLDDITEQSEVTIQNISDLTSNENLNRTTGVSVQEENYVYLRIYVKKEEDMDIVRKICKKQYGDIPALYVKADICRDNLLVEIEGETNVRCTQTK